MEKLTLVAKVRPEKRKEFIDAMQSLQPMRNHLKGIRGSSLFEGNDRNTFRLVDEWETKEDFDRYRQDESFRVFLGALKILCTETEIKFESINAEKSESTENL